MHDASAVQPSPELVDRDPAGRDRWIFWAVAALTVLPMLIGAVVAGSRGWIPTNDGASTVLRAKYALSSDPSLIGMYAYMSSTWIDTPTFFPGPWQLWWMSVPIRVLGTRWGPLLSMAVLNALWYVLAGWLAKRRFGVGAGVGVLLVLAAFSWSLGLASTFTPVPIVAVVIAFAAFVFIAWVVATGDERALPWLALSASFLVLDHLQLTRIVPSIGVAALGSWVVVVLRDRKADEAVWPERKRRSIRAWLLAVAVGVVMWVPSIVQQVTSSDGNLTNLYRAATASRLDPLAKLGWAYPYTVQLYSPPHFWLRGSVSRVTEPPSEPTIVAVTIALGLLVVAAGYVSFRRRDRAAFCGVALAVVVFFATWYNFAGTPLGLYVLPLWPSTLFVTFAIAFALIRALPPASLHGFRPVAVGLAVVLAALTFTHTPNPAPTMGTDFQRRTSRMFDRTVIEAVKGRGTVRLARENAMFPYLSALAVALDDAGVPVCRTQILSLKRSAIPRCGDRTTDVTISIDGTDRRPRGPGTRVIARSSGTPPETDPARRTGGVVVTMTVDRPSG